MVNIVTDEVKIPVCLVTLDVTPTGWRNYTPEMHARACAYLTRKWRDGGEDFFVQALRMGKHSLEVEVTCRKLDAGIALTVQAELAALAELAVCLCECGCGIDLAMDSCGRDAVKAAIPSAEELRMVAVGETVGAIRAMRLRTGLSVTECKDTLTGMTAHIRDLNDLHAEALKAVRGKTEKLAQQLQARTSQVEDLQHQLAQAKGLRVPTPEGAQTITSKPGEKAHATLASFLSNKGLGTHTRCQLEITHHGVELIQVFCVTHSVSYRPRA